MWGELSFLLVLIVQTIDILLCDSKNTKFKKTQNRTWIQHNTTHFLFLSSSKEKMLCLHFELFFSPSSKPSKHTNLSLFFFVFVGWACFWVLLFSKSLFCLFEQGQCCSNGFHTKLLEASFCIIEAHFGCTKPCHTATIHFLVTKSSCITSKLWIHFQPISNFFNSPFRWWFGVYSLWLIHWVTVNATNIGVYFYFLSNFFSVFVDKLVIVWLIGWSCIFLLVKFTRIAGHHITTTFCLLIIKIMFKLEIKHKTKTYNGISAAGDSWTWKLWMNKNKTKTKSHNKYSNK